MNTVTQPGISARTPLTRSTDVTTHCTENELYTLYYSLLPHFPQFVVYEASSNADRHNHFHQCDGETYEGQNAATREAVRLMFSAITILAPQILPSNYR